MQSQYMHRARQGYAVPECARDATDQKPDTLGPRRLSSEWRTEASNDLLATGLRPAREVDDARWGNRTACAHAPVARDNDDTDLHAGHTLTGAF